MNDRYFGTLLAADQEWEGVGHVIEGIHTFFYDDISRISNSLRKCRQKYITEDSCSCVIAESRVTNNGPRTSGICLLT